MLKMSKQGRTLMMFATVSGNPTEPETEKITQLWHSSMFNAHYDLQRYVVGSNRVLFMLTDGAKAWEVKDFLTAQDRCELVTIEGKDYYGKASSLYEGSPPKEPKLKTGEKKSKKKSKDNSDANSTKKKKKGKKDEL
ncbi:hypothetical protein CAPTEDRAFT_177543 [Capitella teleta]|nr:hypothetical protein CAPTEDRAFT_177543 [Capitella teleta]|eukprot:ELT88118.1 hypothetical protein CAPTEDRAFT_177543 [Capitella teleta]